MKYGPLVENGEVIRHYDTRSTKVLSYEGLRIVLPNPEVFWKAA